MHFEHNYLTYLIYVYVEANLCYLSTRIGQVGLSCQASKQHSNFSEYLAVDPLKSEYPIAYQS